MATRLDGNSFLYDGYDMAVFPLGGQADPENRLHAGADALGAERTLEQAGACLVNTNSDDSVHVDRRLITGASPRASHALGELAVATLLGYAERDGW